MLAAIRYEHILRTEDQIKYDIIGQKEATNSKIRAVFYEVETLRQEVDKLKESHSQETKVKTVVTDVDVLVKAEMEKFMLNLLSAAATNKPTPSPVQPDQIIPYNCRRSGHFAKDCKQGMKFHYCQKLDHLIKDYRKR